VFKGSGARSALKVLEIALQEDESKKDLHLLRNEGTTRAWVLSVNIPGVP